MYSEDKGTFIGESWNAKKWLEDNNLSMNMPMAIEPGEQHFYVNEVTLCSNLQYIIPLRWVKRNGELTCDAHNIREVSFDPRS